MPEMVGLTTGWDGRKTHSRTESNTAKKRKTPTRHCSCFGVQPRNDLLCESISRIFLDHSAYQVARKMAFAQSDQVNHGSELRVRTECSIFLRTDANSRMNTYRVVESLGNIAPVRTLRGFKGEPPTSQREILAVDGRHQACVMEESAHN